MRSGATTPDSLSIYLPNSSELSHRVIEGAALLRDVFIAAALGAGRPPR
jgi:hypothetical protein